MGRMTQRFIDEIRRSHEVYTYVDVISPTRQSFRLRVTEGQVNVDRSAQYRRAARMTCIDPLGELVPGGVYGVLTPFGTEVRPYQGVKYDDGTTEVYPLGVFRLSKATVTETGSGGSISISLEMFDRSRTVSRDKFTTPYTVPASTNVVDAAKLILARTFPDLEYDAITTTLTTPGPQVYDTSNDPWQAVTDLATSIGCEIYFNTIGWVVIAPPVDIDALPNPEFTYIEGRGCTMTDLSAVYSDEPGYNGVIVTGASVSNELPPVRAEAWDLEPSSPTYRFGPYGEVPTFVNDNNVTTVVQAQASADALLKGQIGFSSQLNLTAWSNPALEAGDVIEVERAVMHASGLYTVDSFNVPLRISDAQNVVLRQKRIVS